MSKAGKETSEFNQASNDMEQPSPAEHGLLAADDEHHVNHDSQGGQKMTRTALATRQDCARSGPLRNDEVSTKASVENTRSALEHEAHDEEKEVLHWNVNRNKFVSRTDQVGSFLISTRYKVKLKSY